MSNSEETITIPTNYRENLVKHIESLQWIITEKNTLIEALQKENEELIETPSNFLDRIRNEAWREGFKACGDMVKTRTEDIMSVIDRGIADGSNRV